MKGNASPERVPGGRTEGQRARSGTLVYVMGPSGCGKDSLMQHARHKLDGSDRIAFAHRYITRPPEPEGENHVALSDKEFVARRRMDFFALHWRSHGCLYGVGIEIDTWLSRGWTVVVNGSREYYQKARERYPRMRGLLIKVSSECLRARLSSRARETPEQIHDRIVRNERLSAVALEGVVQVRNDGPLLESADKFISEIRQM